MVVAATMVEALSKIRSEPRPYQELTIPTRCPTCGGMVYAPCRLCRARVVRAATLAAWRTLHEGQAPPRRAA